MKKNVLLGLGILLCLVLAGYGNAAETGGAAASGSVWEDQFNTFNPDNWTSQFSGLRLSEEKAPTGIRINEGVMVMGDALAGPRLTSRQKFLYGTFEARVKINPAGSQYFGFMSRAPWGANGINFMSEPGGWHTMMGRDGKGDYAGIYLKPPKDQWYTVKVIWEPNRVAVYLNDGLVGEVTDPAKIPQTPMPIILDIGQPNIPMEFDWIKVTGNTYAGDKAGLPPAAPAFGESLTLNSRDWRVAIDPVSGLVRSVDNLRPTPQTWTPENTRGLDLYIRDFPDGEPVRFVRKLGDQTQNAQGDTFVCLLLPEKEPYQSKVQAGFVVKAEGNQLFVSARLTALTDLNNPVEIGLGLPFQPDLWQRQLFPKNPWLVLHPRQENQVRLPFLADPEDVTVASATGNWNFYPFGILQAQDRSVLWGGMDLGRRLVLSPNNFGSLPAVTLAPKSWPKGKTLELSFSVYNFPKSEKDFPGILRWYLSNCTSSDPLTKDLFPVKDWTPRVLPNGGGVGMPDVRITRMNPKSDFKYFDQVCEKMLKFNIPNLWITLQVSMDGSQPVSGNWYGGGGLPVSAEPLKAEVERIKKLGLKPCSYTNQFITPELLKVDKDWFACDTKGQMLVWASFSADNPAGLGDFFTKELADKLGTRTLTWAYGDFGLDAFRNWYVGQVTGALDYYLPSGLSWDYGWSGMGPYAAYVHGDRKTTLAHGTFRAQADIAAYLRKNHPEMEILVNGAGGEPSQLVANCLLLENSDVMSDFDFLAAKAGGSAMSSMDYFSDHDRNRWTRQMMLDLARGCSFGAPFWTIMDSRESYFETWTNFLDFSGRTTALPFIPDEDAVSGVSGQANIVGTVWSDGRKLMAAAFDRRADGTAGPTVISVKVPKNLSGKVTWKITRLNRLNTEVPVSPVPEYNWKVDGFKAGQVLLSGPMGPGEMVLLENTNQEE